MVEEMLAMIPAAKSDISDFTVILKPGRGILLQPPSDCERQIFVVDPMSRSRFRHCCRSAQRAWLKEPCFLCIIAAPKA